MVLVITRDYFLFTAIQHLLPDENVIQLNDTKKIKIARNQKIKIIIDNFYNNVIHTSLVRQLVFLFPEKVIIFSGFKIKLLFMGVNVTCLNRKIAPTLIVNAINGIDVWEQNLITLTRKQHYILTEIVSGKRNDEIADKMNVSVKTIGSHVSHIKKIIQVSRMHLITKVHEYKYLITK
ncbi:TPA: response regulator transcription factor [Enterobacter asburiae]|jgi:DNA-binding CsgD family transcriptional regulator